MCSATMFKIKKGLLRFTEQGISMYCPETYMRSVAIPLSKIVEVSQTHKIVNIRVFGSSEQRFHYNSHEKAVLEYEKLVEALSTSTSSTSDSKSVQKQWQQESPSPDVWALEQLK